MLKEFQNPVIKIIAKLSLSYVVPVLCHYMIFVASKLNAKVFSASALHRDTLHELISRAALIVHFKSILQFSFVHTTGSRTQAHLIFISVRTHMGE